MDIDAHSGYGFPIGGVAAFDPEFVDARQNHRPLPPVYFE